MSEVCCHATYIKQREVALEGTSEERAHLKRNRTMMHGRTNSEEILARLAFWTTAARPQDLAHSLQLLLSRHSSFSGLLLKDRERSQM